MFKHRHKSRTACVTCNDKSFDHTKLEPDVSRSEKMDISTSTNNIRGVSKSGGRIKRSIWWLSSGPWYVQLICQWAWHYWFRWKQQNYKWWRRLTLSCSAEAEERRSAGGSLWRLFQPEQKWLGVRWVDIWKAGLMGTKKLNRDDPSNATMRFCETAIHTLQLFWKRLWCLTSILAINRWDIETLDVEKAFLRSTRLQWDAFVKPPKEETSENSSNSRQPYTV